MVDPLLQERLGRSSAAVSSSTAAVPASTAPVVGDDGHDAGNSGVPVESNGISSFGHTAVSAVSSSAGSRAIKRARGDNHSLPTTSTSTSTAASTPAFVAALLDTSAIPKSNPRSGPPRQGGLTTKPAPAPAPAVPVTRTTAASRTSSSSASGVTAGVLPPQLYYLRNSNETFNFNLKYWSDSKVIYNFCCEAATTGLIIQGLLPETIDIKVGVSQYPTICYV